VLLGTALLNDASPEAPTRRVPSAVAGEMARWGATPVFDAYWRFAAARQDVLLARLAGGVAPWTGDSVLAAHRFTNVYRFADRVSQDLLRMVQNDVAGRSGEDLVLRSLLFKVFNRTSTWATLVRACGEPTVRSFDPVKYGAVLAAERAAGRKIYSAAYIIPNPACGAATKHDNHLRLLGRLLDDGTIDRIAAEGTLDGVYRLLSSIPSFGPFLAFQFAIDINYSVATRTDEDAFVVPGPGARDGLRKCFPSLPRGAEAQAIMWVAKTQEEHFTRLGVRFRSLAGRRLQPVDCQNLFCEIDKYARVAFPGVAGISGRTRIKQTFSPARRQPVPPLLVPPKWIAARTAREAV
jgi:hypothetical protein